LSGGQRQRIGIARAMYRDADLILFDEATSALDTVTESELVAAIEALPQEKTLMIIAHRLSTVRHCDRILVLSRGRLVAQGSWDENMEKCQSFRKMVEQSV
ncbi:MAG: ATP-binding cassette domain-containing protein, partial [Opitutales bacterium]|nr:ATP-binding cassette domain-containing protein [Opitutales bacterium]